MGKGKGGGGGGGTLSHIRIPPSFNIMNQGVFEPLGTFGTQEMAGLANTANWATNLATGGNVQTGGAMPENGLLAGGQTKTFAPFTTTGGLTSGGGTGDPATDTYLAGLNPQTTGPFLANAIQNLINAQGSTGYLQSLLGVLGPQGTGMVNQGNQMLKRATTGTGLFPSQQAWVNQAVSTEQTNLGTQLAGEGLGNSTLLQSLKGQAQVSGAAAAGQLIQGNIAAAQQEQQLGIDTQQLDAQAEGALFNQFSDIAQQSTQVQAALWSEAMAGYGALGNMMANTVNAFGYGLKTQEDILQANEAYAQDQVGMASAQAQAQAAQSQGFSSMLGGLGSLLGGNGLFSSGGLFGSSGLLSGIIGGIGGAAGAGTGAALGGSAAAGTVADLIPLVAGLAF